ncbi:MAG: hypothetical protein AAF744_10700 [Pseudomonadota bacterium]
MREPNTRFQLELKELEVLEEALLARRRELARMQDTMDRSSPAEAQVLRVIEQDQRTGDELLVRIEELMTFLSEQGLQVLKLDAA